MPAVTSNKSSRLLLDAAYTQLELDKGVLLPASKRPERQKEEEWIEKGDWQALAKDVDAEKIFFVDREPVAVFAELKTSDDASFREFYNKVWCMARPQLLFLARAGELAIYDLGKPPVRQNEEPAAQGRLLERVTELAQVQEKLADYHRERLETGAVFGDDCFGKDINRADRSLIRDLKKVRGALDALNLREGVDISPSRKLELLHSFIGRAIFIRYLEDREIITREYFEKVIEMHAQSERKDWLKRLDQSSEQPDLNPAAEKLFFPRVLTSKDFTYALFDQLAHDFNGDTFPVKPDERRCLLQGHLNTLRNFLLGNSDGDQLFFQAYRFNIIPIELISAIYEEFYNEEVRDDGSQGSHYTPPALVEFVLANTLTPDVLKKEPRVLDPACGSGIFLVEAFRRMVRFVCAEKGIERPTRQELRTILHQQIAGIDINKEAVRVAAFSLYLAFLHYQKPREILPDQRAPSASNRLPYLKWVSAADRQESLKQQPGAEFFDILLAASAFDPVMGKCEAEANRLFGPNSADVVVGNPPWGDPTPKTPREKQAVADLKEWCDPEKGRPLGDKERSQAFIHLTLALLKEGGRSGLLVSSGVLFKHHDNSKAFRKVWLNDVQLRQVVNFAHVRHVFFSGKDRRTKGISPFVSVVFDKRPLADAPDNRFDYWSAKRTAVVENVKAVIMTRGDMHYLKQRDCLAYEKLWKIYWWGGQQDEALINAIEQYPQLRQLPDLYPHLRLHPGRGFEVKRRGTPAEWLDKYHELPVEEFKRYGPLNLKTLRDVPANVYRKGEERIYSGHRLLVGRGIKEGGFIISRLETQKYCFRNSIHGIRLEGLSSWQEAVIIAICWSSLARYYYFATSGSWGFWHFEIHLEDIKQLPVRFPDSDELRDRIVTIVAELAALKVSDRAEMHKRRGKSRAAEQIDLLPNEGSLMRDPATERRRDALESKLNEAIFDLYELNPTERDLIIESCESGLGFFYRNHKSDAVQPVIYPSRNYGVLADVAHAEDNLAAYLRAFLEWWNAEVGKDGEFAWRVLVPSSNAPLLAVVFESRYKHNASAPFDKSDQEAWNDVLKALAKDARVPVGSSRIFIDTFFRVVTDREMLFVKRNERRFWTKTAAREDAEAAMVKAMVLQEEHRRKLAWGHVFQKSRVGLHGRLFAWNASALRWGGFWIQKAFQRARMH